MPEWPTTTEVAPSILSADFARMRERTAEVLEAGARVIHIDVMDGHFVPVITFGPKMVADLADLIHEHGAMADVHLMIEQPERHIEQFAAAGADSITVHVETCPHIHYTLDRIKQLGCRAGVTLNPATPVEAVWEASRYADVLLCMSVNPGWGGQRFIPATLDRLPRLRDYARGRGDDGVAVEVDGGVNRDTIRDVFDAGANVLVAGSAIFGASSPGESFRELTGIVAAAGDPAWGVTPADEAFLRRTLELAERGTRNAAPNPVVGCLLVRDDEVLAEGWHERPGGEHAEAMALRLAGDARGATAYVSLEPCSHHGRTPPCADALVAAGVARVVIAALDPSPKVDGKGLERLRAAGIEVEVAAGDLEAAARRQNAAFRTFQLLGRPHVTYKAAASLDGRTATAAGESRWISAPESRRLVHEWRAGAGAVAVGSGTALHDRPQLTARDVDPPAERQPLRVVFDRGGRVDPASWDGVVARGDAGEELAALAARGVTSVLVEGGATLAAGLLAAGLIDRVALFVAPFVLGDGPGLFTGWAAASLAQAPAAVHLEARPVGPDILLVAELREV